MPYTASSAPPTTAWARHLDRVRRRDGLSQTKAFELAFEALGLGPKSRAAFIPFLIDREPDDAEAKALASVFGWPEPEDAQVPEPAPDLATALLALTDQLEAMRTEIAALQAERAAWQRGVVAALAEMEGRAPAALLASLAPQPS